MKVSQAEYAGTELPGDRLPEIALFGRSNVGKSTLINRLACRDGLAKVGKRPGKTRYRHFFKLDSRLYLVDLPGYGYTEVPNEDPLTWERLVVGYISERPQLVAGILAVDARRYATPLDMKLVEWFRPLGKPLLVVCSKVDKLKQNERAALRKGLVEAYRVPADAIFLTSLRETADLDRLRRVLLDTKRLSNVFSRTAE